MARCLDVLHQVHAIGPQRPVNAPQKIERPRLIVNGIESRYEVEGFRLRLLIEIAEIE